MYCPLFSISCDISQNIFTAVLKEQLLFKVVSVYVDSILPPLNKRRQTYSRCPSSAVVEAWSSAAEASWNVMAHAQKPDFVFRRNGRFPLNRRGRQFSRLLAAEVSASAVVMLDTPCSKVVWRVLATHSIRQFPLHFPIRGSPCAITFQLKSTSSMT